ncbi:unnamed protein product [Blepharisma stoltei]|uniref:Uncharacterized protein n=1 Tax=Blepharisma stoltei TaxID=1481888 RepID=A0AAU9KDJ6_9CILI|nr:unnamed protein product [Blepharisma stoltei]
MYIGPWQEYKLAQVLKLKNDIYEGSAPSNQTRLNAHVLSLHNKRFDAGSKAHSTPTARSISSETIQKPYPTFDLDTYYKQCKRIENLIAKSETTDETYKKPPIPKNNIRVRKTKNAYVQRLQKMRTLYGLDKEETKSTLDASSETKETESRQGRCPLPIPRYENKNSQNIANKSPLNSKEFSPGIRKIEKTNLLPEVRKSAHSASLSQTSLQNTNIFKLNENTHINDMMPPLKSIDRNENSPRLTENNSIFQQKSVEKFSPAVNRKKLEECKQHESEKIRSESIIMDDKQKAMPSPVLKTFESKDEGLEIKYNSTQETHNEESRFTSNAISKISEKKFEIEEESCEQIDGLLKWVNELPDEISMGSPGVSSKGIVI